MSSMTRRQLLSGLWAATGSTLAQKIPARSSAFDCEPIIIPITLDSGTIRTPPFPVRSTGFALSIRLEKRIPFHELNCKMGLNESFLQVCHEDPLLAIDWKIWDGDRLVRSGSLRGRDHGGAWAKDSIDRYMGGFEGERNKAFIIELTTTQDGGILKTCNPKLIIEADGNWW